MPNQHSLIYHRMRDGRTVVEVSAAATPATKLNLSADPEGNAPLNQAEYADVMANHGYTVGADDYAKYVQRRGSEATRRRLALSAVDAYRAGGQSDRPRVPRA